MWDRLAKGAKRGRRRKAGGAVAGDISGAGAGAGGAGEAGLP